MSPTCTVVGVDIGGTKTAAALVRVASTELITPASGSTGAPEVLARVELATDVSSEAACLEVVYAAVERVRADEGAQAIGVGTASFVDVARGIAVDSVHLPLAGVPLRALLEARFGVPVAVDNDATAACLGEHVFGAGRGTREMLMLTLGTGVGGGIICRGRPYRGLSGVAGELGHIVIDSEGPKCPGNCPNRGCLEAYVSGRAMGAAARAAAEADPGSALGRALAAGATVDGRLLTRLALGGDAGAAAVLEGIGRRLGIGLTTLVNIFNPELIVIGGGAAAAGELLLAPARRVVAERALRPARDQVRLVAATLGPDAGVFGAAALAVTECLLPAQSGDGGPARSS